MDSVLILFIIIAVLDITFDVISTRLGRFVYVLIIRRQVNDDEYHRKSFVFRLIGISSLLTLYAVLFLLFGR